MLEPLKTRKKSVRECKCKTTKPKEEEEEITTLEPEKVSEKNNGTIDLSLPSVESGNDYGYLDYDADLDLRTKDQCNAKTESFTVPFLCLGKCSKSKKCQNCQKICMYDTDVFRNEKTHINGKLPPNEKKFQKNLCDKNKWVLLRDYCHPKCKKASDCKKFPKNDGKNVRCESVCV